MGMDTSELPFPKPGKKGKKKITREQDPHYVWWVHGWTCCVPGCATSWPVHAHHVIRRSQGGSDRSCVPLCHKHHVSEQGVHTMGVITFERTYRINLLQKVHWYNEQFDAGTRGPRQDLLTPFPDGSVKSS